MFQIACIDENGRVREEVIPDDNEPKEPDEDNEDEVNE